MNCFDLTKGYAIVEIADALRKLNNALKSNGLETLHAIVLGGNDDHMLLKNFAGASQNLQYQQTIPDGHLNLELIGVKILPRQHLEG
jgi:hypothetical protein